MFEKEAKEYGKRISEGLTIEKGSYTEIALKSGILGFEAGAEFGYNKANEWHKVSDKLPEIDVLVYLWNGVDDFPVVARRHIPYGHKEWVWHCKWGSGYTASQSVGKDYLWKEIVLPKED